MAKTVQLAFTISLTDPALVKAKQAAYPDGWIHGPQPAATELSAELGYSVAYQERDDPFVAPCVRTAWHPRASSGKFKYDRAVFTISGGGFFGWLGFGDTRFVWVGTFVYAPPDDDTKHGPLPEAPGDDPYEWAPLSTRIWADGFEAVDPNNTKGEGGTGKGLMTRDASRAPDGYGLAIRSAGNGVAHAMTESGLSATAAHWERVYLRLRRAPQTSVPFWRLTLVGGSGAEGLKLYITPSGQISISSTDNSSVETAQGTLTTLPLNEWVKLDAFFESYIAPWPPPAGPAGPFALFCLVTLYVNGGASGSGGASVPVRQPHASPQYVWNLSDLGSTGSGHSLELDIDDWIGAVMPSRFRHDLVSWEATIGGNIVLDQFIYRDSNGIRRYYRALQAQAVATIGPPNAAYWVQSLGPRDFFSGSHVLAVRPLAFGPAHQAASWPGDVRLLLRQPMDSNANSDELTSAISGAVLEVTTDATKYGQGVAALSIAVHGSHSGATMNTVGAGLAGAAPAMTTLTQTNAREWHAVVNQPGGASAPRTIHPLTLRLTKAATTDPNTVQTLLALPEYIGVFDACDLVLDPSAADQVKPAAPRLKVGTHNAPFPNSPWASLTATPPLAGVVAKAGTYTGNNTGQDLVLGVAPHLVWIRPLTGAQTGQRWWSSMLGAGHVALEGSYQLDAGVTICQEDTSYVSPGGASDSEERYLVRVSGASPQINATGVTYQYVILSDPGSRFLLNGALRHGAHGADDGAVHALIDSGFLAEFLLAWAEFHVTPRDTATARFWGKGPGHAADEASRLNAAATASAINLATAGQIKTFSALNALGEQLAYAACRTSEPGSATPSEVVFQVRAYVGNGAAGTRDLVLSPVSGKRPLFAIVVPDNAAAVYRDPSHASGASRAIDATADITTGIVGGGVDFLSVGPTLNATGVDYSVLVLVGGTAAGNDGWSANGEFVLVTPAAAGGTQYEPAPFDLDDLTDEAIEDLGATPGAGGGTGDASGEGPTLDPPDLDDDLAACPAPTLAFANLALARTGITTEITSLDATAPPLSLPAVTIRRFYDLALQATLRDRPWGFATRYATLTRVAGSAGTAANSDWQYAYRLPDNCLLPRRIVRARGPALDPTAPPMREAGGLIFTNEATVSLEYTARVTCPARANDATFRNAWAWRLAEEIAISLTGLKERGDFCAAQYQAALATEDAQRRLGSPGLPPAADATDPDAAALVDKLQVINLALVHAGGQTIGSLTEQSREATAAALVYEHELRAVLRDALWPFAKRYATLTLVAGTTTVPANPDWYFSYREPADCVRVRRLPRPLETFGIGKLQFDPEPAAWERGSDATGPLIFSNEEHAVVEYTARVSIALADEHFVNALAWRLGAALAPSVATPDPAAEEAMGQQRRDEKTPRATTAAHLQLQQLRDRRAAYCWARYREALRVGEAGGGNEQQRGKPEGDTPDWIRGR